MCTQHKEIILHYFNTLKTKVKFYLAHLNREAIEIHKHKNYFNKKEECLRVKESWYPTLSACKTKPYTSEDLNIPQPDADQLECRRKDLDMVNHNQHHQQQG